MSLIIPRSFVTILNSYEWGVLAACSTTQGSWRLRCMPHPRIWIIPYVQLGDDAESPHPSGWNATPACGGTCLASRRETTAVQLYLPRFTCTPSTLAVVVPSAQSICVSRRPRRRLMHRRGCRQLNALAGAWLRWCSMGISCGPRGPTRAKQQLFFACTTVAGTSCHSSPLPAKWPSVSGPSRPRPDARLSRGRPTAHLATGWRAPRWSVPHGGASARSIARGGSRIGATSTACGCNSDQWSATRSAR